MRCEGSVIYSLSVRMITKKVFMMVGLSAVCSANAFGESADELIRKGDAHAQRYEEEAALKHYLAARKMQPSNPRLLAAISKEYRHLMSDAEEAREKVGLGAIALMYANQASAAAPNKPDGHLAVAITQGKLLSYTKGSGDKLERSRQIRAAAEKVIELDSRNDTAWHVLGCWHKGVAEIGGMKRALGGLVHDIPKSTYENAEECFKQAIKLNPKRAMHYIELGCVYAAMGKEDKAKEMIEYGLSLPNTEKDDPTTKAKGRQVLASL